MTRKNRLRKELGILVILFIAAALPVNWYYAKYGGIHGSRAKQDQTLAIQSQRLEILQNHFTSQVEATIASNNLDQILAGYPSDPKPAQSQKAVLQNRASLQFQNEVTWMVILSILFILVSTIMIWLIATSLLRDGSLGWSFLIVMILLILAVVVILLGIGNYRNHIFGLIVSLTLPAIEPVLTHPNASWIWIGAGSVITWMCILAGAIKRKDDYLAWAAALIPVWAVSLRALLIIFDKIPGHSLYNHFLMVIVIFYGLILITFALRAAGFAYLKRFFQAVCFLFLAAALFFSVLLPYPWL